MKSENGEADLLAFAQAAAYLITLIEARETPGISGRSAKREGQVSGPLKVNATDGEIRSELRTEGVRGHGVTRIVNFGRAAVMQTPNTDKAIMARLNSHYL